MSWSSRNLEGRLGEGLAGGGHPVGLLPSSGEWGWPPPLIQGCFSCHFALMDLLSRWHTPHTPASLHLCSLHLSSVPLPAHPMPTLSLKYQFFHKNCPGDFSQPEALLSSLMSLVLVPTVPLSYHIVTYSLPIARVRPAVRCSGLFKLYPSRELEPQEAGQGSSDLSFCYQKWSCLSQLEHKLHKERPGWLVHLGVVRCWHRAWHTTSDQWVFVTGWTEEATSGQTFLNKGLLWPVWSQCLCWSCDFVYRAASPAYTPVWLSASQMSDPVSLAGPVWHLSGVIHREKHRLSHLSPILWSHCTPCGASPCFAGWRAGHWPRVVSQGTERTLSLNKGSEFLCPPDIVILGCVLWGEWISSLLKLLPLPLSFLTL